MLRVDDMVEVYNSTLFDICGKISPVIIKEVRERPQQVWYTSDLQAEKREKRRAERKYLKHRNEENEVDYKLRCTQYYSNIDRTRIEYYTNVISTKKNDMKAIYGIVNKLSGDGQQNILPKAKSEKELANSFASYFVSKISEIRARIDEDRGNSENIEGSGGENSVRNRAGSFGIFEPITTEEFNNVYKDMKKKNYTKDPIPVRAHIKIFEDIQSSMVSIVNRSLEQGIFPQSLKQSQLSSG